MKITNKISVIAASFCILCVACATFACKSINTDKDIYNKIEKEKITGELLFKGLFFGNEVISKYVPEIKLAASKNLASEQFSENMAKYIKENRPQFFDEFKRDIESGDHIVIGSAIDRGMELYKTATIKLKSEGLLNPQSSAFVYETLCVTSILAVDISNAGQLATIDQKLLKDKIIDSIVKNLSV